MANRFFTFNKTVAATGTQEPLSATPLRVAVAIIQTLRTNTGYITVGALDADYATNIGVNLGVPVADSTPPSIVFRSTREANEVDLAKFYIDAETNGDGVSVACLEA